MARKKTDDHGASAVAVAGPARTKRSSRGKKRVPDVDGAGGGDLLENPPETADALHAWLEKVVGVSVCRRPLVEGHSAPMDYLTHVFFEGALGRPSGAPAKGEKHSADCLVWANRGGGKTFLAAVATMLDLVFKPGVQVRLLGGSLEQSQRMYEHLRGLFESPMLAGMVKGRPTVRRLALDNGSVAQVLSASQTAVRGTRVQKVRCDEVDLFDQSMWDAAQLTTRSMKAKGPWGNVVKGSIEALSTMHVPFGLMQRLVDQAQSEREPGGLLARPVFKWGVLDVLETCGDEHSCESCSLFAECGGRAKGAGGAGSGQVAEWRSGEVGTGQGGSLSLPVLGEGGGHIRVADASAMKARVGAHTWASEMLCITPKRSDCVYSEFAPARHVVDDAQAESGGGGPIVALAAGMDFGFRSESALVLGALHADGRLVILREHVRTQTTVGELATVLRGWVEIEGEKASGGEGGGKPMGLSFLAVDPAGLATSDQTGKSSVEVLREAGFVVRARGSQIQEGISLIRSRLLPAMGGEGDGGPRLLVHQRCRRLIECLSTYHYPPDQPESMEPVKDGSDHACDALRYLVLAVDGRGQARSGRY